MAKLEVAVSERQAQVPPGTDITQPMAQHVALVITGILVGISEADPAGAGQELLETLGLKAVRRRIRSRYAHGGDRTGS
jgi:hypothetical protein